MGAIGRAGVELVILARGGGSIEDLWCFNDERVARAVAACPVPVVTGVGHETDFTIADFVADVRAPTPTAAAELATPDGRELSLATDDLRERLERAMGWCLSTERSRLDRLIGRLEAESPARDISARQRDVAAHSERLARAAAGWLRLRSADLAGHSRRLAALSPAATLARGYARIERRADGRPVTSVRDVAPGAGLDVRVADGSFPAVVEGQARLFGDEESNGLRRAAD
jgi:exodeoxyribonuclease VII large subunit